MLMRGVQTVREVFHAIAGVKAKGSAFCTNFYPAADKLERWIARNQFKMQERGDSVFLLRRDRAFWHLHFSARDPEALRTGLRELHELQTEPVVCDLLGESGSLSGTAAALEEVGLGFYKELVRMARTTPPMEAGDCAQQILPAQLGECEAVLGLIEQTCDRYAKQIPDLEEIEAAVFSRQILTLRDGNALAGLLHFETRGATSTLRYWVVAPEFQNRHIGSALMRRYLASHPHVRRFVLWVNSDNADALHKYQHYHYARDGVVDRIFANNLIPK
jgi:GNAT superfamily N-acetyltransferase